MKIQDCLVIVLGENDKKFPAVIKHVETLWQGCKVACVHTPIGLNTTPTTNSFYKVLAASSENYVVVVIESELDKATIEVAIAKFDKERENSPKPLLRKWIGIPNFEWYGQYDFAAAIVVARRMDLFDVLKHQLSLNQETNSSEGESK